MKLLSTVQPYEIIFEMIIYEIIYEKKVSNNSVSVMARPTYIISTNVDRIEMKLSYQVRVLYVEL